MLKSISDSNGKSFSTVVLMGKDNYQVWSYTMREHLKTSGLERCIQSSTDIALSGDEVVKTEVEFARKAQEAKSMLISAMSGTVIEQILHCSDAASIWTHLEKTFGAKNSNLKLELMGELSTLNCSSVKEVPAMVNRAYIIKGKLENLGVQIDDTMIISTLIRALPKSYYKNFLESWAMLDAEQQTLTRFETKLLEKTRNIEDDEVALIATQAGTYQRQPAQYQSGMVPRTAFQHGRSQPAWQNSGVRGHSSQQPRVGNPHASQHSSVSQQSPQNSGHAAFPRPFVRSGNHAAFPRPFVRSESHATFPRPPVRNPNHAAFRPPIFHARPPAHSQGALDPNLCAYCRKPGHWKQDCFRRQRKLMDAYNTENALTAGEIVHENEYDEEPAEIAFMATECKTVASLRNDTKHKTSTWIIDSGASSHMTSDFGLISNYQSFKKPKLILIGDDTALEATGFGQILFTQGSMTALYVPALGSKNLFSVASETKSGVGFNFDNTGVNWTVDGKTIYRGIRRGNTYYFEFDVNQNETAYSATTLENWHRRLGHIPKELIVKMVREKIVDGLNIGSTVTDKCQDCQLNKCRRTNHPQRTTQKVDKSGQSLHMDVIGPIKPDGLAGQRFILVIVDEFSKFRIVSCLKAKSQVPETVKIAINQAELQTGSAVLTITSDNGSEFTSERLTMFLQHKGIYHHLSAPYTPQQNGTAERENQTLINQARTLLNASGLTKQLWPEAIMTATYISNRCITRCQSVTPHELWCKQRPNLRHLRTFGEQCSVLKQDHQRGKFDTKGTLMYFVGYTDNSNNYKCFDPTANSIVISCDVSFMNKTGPFSTVGQSTDTIEETVDLTGIRPAYVNHKLNVDFTTVTTDSNRGADNQTEVRTQTNSQTQVIDDSMCDYTSANENTFIGESDELRVPSDDGERTITETKQPASTQSDPEQPEQSKKGPSEFVKNIANMISSENTSDLPIPSQYSIVRNKNATYEQLSRGRWDLDQANVAAEQNVEPPRTFKEIEHRSDGESWLEAMAKEMESMQRNEVYDLVARPPNTNVVGCRWVFTMKVMPNGETRPKARLVARGFSQQYGVDYSSTFAPVVQIEAIRLLFSVAAQRRLFLTQCDIKTAFLYGHLDTEIFMEQPPGYEQNNNYVWRLQKSIYGLKQAPRCWCERIIKYLTDIGLTQSKVEHCILYQLKPLAIVAIYVDDLIVITENKCIADDIIRKLATEFEVNIMKTGKFLGLQYQTLPNGDLFVHQERYLTEVLQRFEMWDLHPVDTPMDPGQAKGGPEEPLDESFPFREIIGALNYAATQCRPDIAFTVGWLGRKVTRPTRMDWNVLVRCMRYLRGTLDYGIRYGNSPDKLIAYSDADYAGDSASYKSTSGQLITYNANPIAWKSKLQSIVTTSTTEAEYVAVSSTIKSTLCLRHLCLELGFITPDPIPLKCDNKGAVLIATNESSTQRTRHLGAQLAFAQQEQIKGTVSIEQIPGTEQLADIFTKPLNKEKFKSNRDRLLTRKSIIMSIIQILMFITVITAQMIKIDSVTWLKSNHYVEAGKKLIRIRVNIKNRCVDFQDSLSSLTHNSTMITVVQDALARCEKFRHDKYLSTLNEFETTRFSVEEEEVMRLTRPKRSTNQTEDDEDNVGPVSPGSYWATWLIPGYHSIYEYHNENSGYNTVWKNRKATKAHDRLLANQGQRLDNMESIHKLTIDSIKRLGEGLGQTAQKVEEMYHQFPKIWSAESQIYNAIQRDADLLDDLRNSFKKEQFNVFAVRKLMQRGFNLTRQNSSDVSRSLEYLDSLAPESTQMAYFDLKDSKMNFYVIAPIKYPNATIFEAEVFKNWIDINTYNIYVGPTFVLVNSTNNCTKFIDKPKSLEVIDACTNEDSSIEVNPLFETRTIYDNNRVEETAPKIIITKTHKLIQCFQNTMFLNNHTCICEKYPVAVPLNSSISIRGIYHTIDDSQILLEQEYKPKLNFNNETIIAPWVAHMNIVANNMKQATWHLSLIEDLRLQAIYDLICSNPDLTRGLMAGFPTIMIFLIVIIVIYHKCKQDPITSALHQQVLCNISGRSKSEPILFPQTSPPTISINIGNSNRTLQYGTTPEETKVSFHKMYPELVSTGHSNRPATPYYKQVQPSITMPDDDTQSIASSRSNLSKKSMVKGIRKGVNFITDRAQMCHSRLKEDVISIKSSHSLNSVASYAHRASGWVSNSIRSIHSYLTTPRHEQNLSNSTRKLNGAAERVRAGLRNLVDKPDRFPKPDQISTISLPTNPTQDESSIQ